MTSFGLSVSKDYTTFCAGHFVTFEGDKCEPLHGHNYRVRLSLEGGLDEHSFIYNFVTLKKLLREFCDSLDHRMLLPTGNPLLDIRLDGDSYVVSYGSKKYRFPAEDVVQLPVPNTTSERLAEWLAHGILERLKGRGPHQLSALTVEVEETSGQSAYCRLPISQD